LKVVLLVYERREPRALGGEMRFGAHTRQGEHSGKSWEVPLTQFEKARLRRSQPSAGIGRRYGEKPLRNFAQSVGGVSGWPPSYIMTRILPLTRSTLQWGVKVEASHLFTLLEARPAPVPNRSSPAAAYSVAETTRH